MTKGYGNHRNGEASDGIAGIRIDVDISIIKQGGKFDNPPYIKVQ